MFVRCILESYLWTAAVIKSQKRPGPQESQPAHKPSMLKCFMTAHHGSATAEIRAQELQSEYEFSLGRSLYPAVNNSSACSPHTVKKPMCLWQLLFYLLCSFQGCRRRKVGLQKCRATEKVELWKKMASVPEYTTQ